MKHALTSDNKSITVGHMKHAHTAPDVYECAGLMPKQKALIKWFFWVCDEAACVCDAQTQSCQRHTHTRSLVILIESFRLLG